MAKIHAQTPSAFALLGTLRPAESSFSRNAMCRSGIGFHRDGPNLLPLHTQALQDLKV
jgi:hypothetical protein